MSLQPDVARELASSTTRVVIADGHAVLRSGVRAVLERATDPRFEVVAEASDPSQTTAAVQRHRPDLLILDVGMHPGSGLSLLQTCRRIHPATAIVVLTMHEDESFVRDALQAGVQGYILKDAEPRDLIGALRAAVRRTAITLSPGVAAKLAAAPSRATEPLSSREREILAMVARGYTYQEIGQRLYCSERTIKTYRARAAGKLGMSSRAELTAFAHREGLVTSEQIASGG